MPTLEITNLGGPLTRKDDGDINSGFARYETSWGYDPYSKPGNLTWLEQPTSILSSASGAGNNFILAMKQRNLVSSALAVYAVDEGQRLQKIRVDNTGTQTADLDSPSVVGTMAIAPTHTTTTGMVFYGSPEKIFYGDGNGHLQKINFDGSGAASIYGTNSVVTLVPRPMVTFLGKIYFGNGNNIGEIDTTELITTGTKLNPALPNDLTVRDLDVSPDGNYMQITAARNDVAGNFTNWDTTLGATTDSTKFYWNGVDTSATASEKIGGTFATSNNVFGDKNYIFGQDQMGANINLGGSKRLSLPRTMSPSPTATFSSGNMAYFMSPEFEQASNKFKGALYGYGKYDDETPGGLFRFLRVDASAGANYEIRSVPGCIPVSNLLYAPDYVGYTNEIAESGKIYFTTVENNADVDVTGRIGKLWRQRIIPTGVGSVVAGVYETQTQLFSKKIAVKEVRLYTGPLAADNAFEVDLIGSGGSVLSGGSRAFTVGTNVTAGEDLVRYNPATAPTYALGVRITNASVTGTRNWTGVKLEIDHEPAGK